MFTTKKNVCICSYSLVSITVGKYLCNFEKADFSESQFLEYAHGQRSYAQMVIYHKVWRVWTWSWYQIKAESVLLTMIPQTNLDTKMSLYKSLICECITYGMQSWENLLGCQQESYILGIGLRKLVYHTVANFTSFSIITLDVNVIETKFKQFWKDLTFSFKMKPKTQFYILRHPRGFHR